MFSETFLGYKERKQLPFIPHVHLSLFLGCIILNLLCTIPSAIQKSLAVV